MINRADHEHVRLPKQTNQANGGPVLLVGQAKKGKGDGPIFNKKFGPDFPGETFRVFKEKEQQEYGEYRTHRLVSGVGFQFLK
jgi:hypothetical protein